jgi:hypothetical protein
MNNCRLTSLIRLSYLAPDIVRALLEGGQPVELTPMRLLQLSKNLPHDWKGHCHTDQVEAVFDRGEARLRHWNRLVWLSPGRQ